MDLGDVEDPSMLPFTPPRERRNFLSNPDDFENKDDEVESLSSPSRPSEKKKIVNLQMKKIVEASSHKREELDLDGARKQEELDPELEDLQDFMNDAEETMEEKGKEKEKEKEKEKKKEKKKEKEKFSVKTRDHKQTQELERRVVALQKEAEKIEEATQQIKKITSFIDEFENIVDELERKSSIERSLKMKSLVPKMVLLVVLYVLSLVLCGVLLWTVW